MVLEYPAIWLSGKSWTPLSFQTTTRLNFFLAIRSVAYTPKALAINLSLWVGCAPLWTCPSTVTLVSAKKKFNRVVVWKDRGVQDLPLNQIAGYSKTIQKNDPLIKVAKGLGIYIGEIN